MAPNLTQILEEIADGNADGTERLWQSVYDELRLMARGMMARIPAGQTLQATALVNEAYVKLLDSEKVTSKGRRYFFKSAAEAMRRILVDQARRKGRQKRGGDWARIEISEVAIAAESQPDEILSIHEALDGLCEQDPIAGELVKLRFFVGMTNLEAAQAVGISERSANRNWLYARAWLGTALNRIQDKDH